MSANIIDHIFKARSQDGVFIPTPELTHRFIDEARQLAVERREAFGGQHRQKFDGCDDADEATKRKQIKARQLLEQYSRYLRTDVLEGGKFDENDIAMASEGLTYFFKKVYERKYPELPAYSGLILPISEEVDPGAERYTWWERDLFGSAQTASTYNEDMIPMVGGPTAAENVGRIKPYLNGWKTNFRTKIREALARKNGKPDFRTDEGKADAAQLGHAEAINAQFLWGDEGWGIPGLMNETRIRVIPAPNGVNNSPLWINKTADEIVFDLMTMVNAMHQFSNKTRRARRVLLPQEQFDFASSTPRSSGVDTTILGFVTNALRERGQPVEFRGVIEFNAAKSYAYNGCPANLLFNRAVIIDPDETAATFELPVRPEMPMAPKNTGLGEVHFMHSRAGGLRLEDAQSVIFFDGI